MRVLLIAGGPSPEACVSRVSAEEVAKGLRAAGHEATQVELDSSLPKHLADCDVAFPLAHGGLGEDGCLQGLLEVLGVPYVGADVRASAIASHKPTAKALFAAAGLPVAKQRVLRRDRVSAEREVEARALVGEFGGRIVVKPASGGSALGVERVLDVTVDSVRAALERVLGGDDALVESYHEGLEVTCGVLDNPHATALPPTLIHAEAAEWYDFRSRYQAGGSRHECPAPLPDAALRQIQELALAAHDAVGARDLSRVDFIVSEGSPILLEVNTLPGMTSTSLFPEAAAVTGLPFPKLCDLLVTRAHRRPRTEWAAAPPIPTA